MASKVKSLVKLCFRYIERNFNSITTDIGVLPPHLIQSLVDYMMKERKWGSRRLTDDNLSRLFVPGLEILDIESFWISDKPFANINCPSLTYVNLNDCLQVGDIALKALSNCTKLKVIKLKGCHLITDDGLAVLSKNCKQLQVLYTAAEKVTDIGIIDISTHCNQLKKLVITRGRQLTSKSLISIAENCTQLEIFSISEFRGFLDPEIKELSVKGFPNLRILKLQNCHEEKLCRLSSLPSFACFSHLTSFKIESQPVLTDISALSSCVNLQVFKLIRCERMNDISVLAPIASNLQILSLQGTKKITDISFGEVSKNFSSKITSINIEDCRRIIHIIGDFTNLEKLNLGWSGIPNLKIQCSSLTELSIEGLSLNDSNLKKLFEDSPNIKSLNMRECHLVTDESMKLISSLSKLEILNISKCLKLKNPTIASDSLKQLFLSGTIIKSISIQCINLSTLDVSGCSELANSSLIQCLQKSGSSLANFWACFVTNCDDTIVDALGIHCPSLKMINFTKNDKISDEAVSRLIATCKKLRRVYLNGCTNIKSSGFKSLDVVVTVASRK